jgi:DNA-binding MarR family transcriptional regulator
MTTKMSFCQLTIWLSIGSAAGNQCGMKPSPARSPATPAKASRASSARAEAVAELIFDVIKCFFRIRAFGLEEGFITNLGGAYGFIRSLALHGPLSVPVIARMRPVSRQRMQKLADHLAGEGLVAFIDNPKHRRSKLVKLTAKGDTYYAKNTERLLALVSTLQMTSDETKVRKAAGVIDELCGSLVRVKGAPLR